MSSDRKHPCYCLTSEIVAAKSQADDVTPKIAAEFSGFLERLGMLFECNLNSKIPFLNDFFCFFVKHFPYRLKLFSSKASNPFVYK